MEFRWVGIEYITKRVENDFKIVPEMFLHARYLDILEHIINGMLPS